MTRQYLTTKDICEKFRCSSRTIFRRMKRDNNPFPAPLIKQAGSFNLWCSKSVAAWEDREIERTARDQFLEEQSALHQSITKKTIH